MKESDLKDALSGILPTARSAFTDEMDPPYIIYMPTDRSKGINADDAVAARGIPWRIELYSQRILSDVEKQIEDTLDALGIIWNSDETFIPDEKMRIKYYFFEEWWERE